MTLPPHSLQVSDDPRWSPFLENIGRSPEQLAAIKFEVNSHSVLWGFWQYSA